MRSGFATEITEKWQSRLPHYALADSFRTDIEVGMGTVLGASMSTIASTIGSFATLGVDTRPLKMFSFQLYELERRNGSQFADDYQADRSTYFLFPLIREAPCIEDSSVSNSSSFARLDLLQCFLGYCELDTLRPVPLEQDIDMLREDILVQHHNGDSILEVATTAIIDRMQTEILILQPSNSQLHREKIKQGDQLQNAQLNGINGTTVAVHASAIETLQREL